MSQSKSPRFQMPDGNQVEFEFEPVEAKAFNEQQLAQGKSAMAYDQVLVARVYSPGVSKRQVPVLEIERHFHEGHTGAKIRRNTFHYPRFAQYLEMWRGGGGQGVAGTPLEQTGLFNVALIAMYRHNGVETVEQLAKVPDSALHILGIAGRESRDKATAYLAAKTGGEAIASLDERMKALEAAMQRAAGLEKENAEQAAMIADLQKQIASNKAA